MNNIQNFTNGIFNLEVKVEGEEILFSAEQVAKSLGIVTKTTKNGKKYENVRWSRINEFLPQVAELKQGSFISEPMVYKLAFKANNAVAEKFTDWLAVEVLPQIRKTGSYGVRAPQTMKEALQLALEQQEEIEALGLENSVQKQQIAELQPKASYYDWVLQTKGLISISIISKQYGRSAQWLNELLHELGIQYKQGGVWLLYQKYAAQGYTKTNFAASDAEKLHPHTKWTQKGMLFIYELLKKQEILPTIEQYEEI